MFSKLAQSSINAMF
ncbi:hypothetical protein [Shigella boydii]|nr:hypothetical protein [Shigella boydii]EHY3022484.1 hypothetical protein [Shigella boydii]EJD4418761.1 hypothetical protein [Shigella boydii]MDS1503587.1 hypothetical protein [Shigella boydii]WNT66344.1 hypothetical protein PWR52_09620 [Shigella boydii]HCS1417919.1 hypothetical protein [Shigella boydii]